MPTYNKKIVYLSDAQRQELFANGSIVVGGETFTYDPTDSYVTPQGVNMSIGTVSTLPAGSNATAAIRGTVDNPILDLGIPSAVDTPVSDVQLDGTSVVSNGVAEIPVASNSTLGVVCVNDDGFGGLLVNQNTGELTARRALYRADLAGNSQTMMPTPAGSQTYVFYGLSKAAGYNDGNNVNVGVYTEPAKSAISTMLTSPVSVSGSTPSITALPGIRYVCGECTTLDITLPASGCIDVTFESGSTPTVLTVTPPTGATVKWAGGFDPTSLDADTTYEINICDGLGVAGQWT